MRLRILVLSVLLSAFGVIGWAGAAHASCDPVTLHGSGCTQSIRCLPANAGLECL